jgi:ectoine hydroxylase-related dioxygenase (phytanoyl-CoA dioxygenase family)
MATKTPTLPTDEQITTFRDDGAVYLPGVFTDWVETLRAGIERNIAEPSADAKIYEGTDGRFFGDYCNWDRIPEFRSFIFESPAAAVAARIMGASEVRLFHEHVLVKEPGADVPTPWHQDGPYYCAVGPQTVSLWIPLDPVERDRTLEFVAGSHQGGIEYRPERFNRTALVEGDTREPVPDIEGDREHFRVIGYAMAPGDAVGFQYMILHGAPGNPSRAQRRRAFSLRLLGDGARFVKRDGPTSPPMRDVTLADGDPIDGPQFPVLWRAA